MKLNCEGDYLLQQQWLEKHKNADFLVYDTESGVPKEAIYRNPIYTACVEEPRKFWRAVNDLMQEEEP